MAFELLHAPMRIDKISQPFIPGKHRGIDLVDKRGTKAPVYAAADGTVVNCGNGVLDKSYGNQVFIYHGDGYYTNYAHLSKIVVKNGAKVKAGQLIGYQGSTGNSTGNHLHFEVWPKRSFAARIDPKPFLDALNYNYTVSMNVTNLRVRKGPSTDTKQLGKLAKGSGMHVDSISGDWAFIDAPIEGYVYKKYIKAKKK